MRLCLAGPSEGVKEERVAWLGPSIVFLFANRPARPPDSLSIPYHALLCIYSFDRPYSTVPTIHYTLALGSYSTTKPFTVSGRGGEGGMQGGPTLLLSFSHHYATNPVYKEKEKALPTYRILSERIFFYCVGWMGDGRKIKEKEASSYLF